jgi:hypothetical protein
VPFPEPHAGEEGAAGAENAGRNGRRRRRAQEPHFGVCCDVGSGPGGRVAEQPPAKRGQRVGAAAGQPEVATAAASVQSEGTAHCT